MSGLREILPYIAPAVVIFIISYPIALINQRKERENKLEIARARANVKQKITLDTIPTRALEEYLEERKGGK